MVKEKGIPKAATRGKLAMAETVLKLSRPAKDRIKWKISFHRWVMMILGVFSFCKGHGFICFY